MYNNNDNDAALGSKLTAESNSRFNNIPDIFDLYNSNFCCVDIILYF